VPGYVCNCATARPLAAKAFTMYGAACAATESPHNSTRSGPSEAALLPTGLIVGIGVTGGREMVGAGEGVGVGLDDGLAG